MATPTATPTTGKSAWGAEPETLREDESGWYGVRWFHINDRDLSNAIEATGLPKCRPIPDSWSPSLPNLIVVDRQFKEIGGIVDLPQQRNGWSACRVEYRTPTGRGRITPVLGKSYSEWESTSEAITRFFDVRVNPPAGTQFVLPPGGPGPTPIDQINNGRGTPVGAGRIRVMVHKWVLSSAVDLSRINDLILYRRLNLDVINVPPILDDTRVWTFQPGQLQYTDFRMAMDGGLMKTTHILDAGPDFIHRWQPEDSDGKPTGPVIENVVYSAANFAGLW